MAGRRTYRSRSGRISLLAIALFLTTTCKHDPLVPFCPLVYGVGVIEGHVSMSGRPLEEVPIGARRLDGPGSLSALSRSDSSGAYRLEVPSGLYRLEVDPYGNGFSYSSRDTVRVETGTRHLDLVRGELGVRVAMPAMAEGSRIECRLDPIGSGSSEYESSRVTDGIAEFSFHGILPNIYALLIRLDSGASAWMPGTTSEAAADHITVDGSRPVMYEAVLDGSAAVTGTVRGSWQEAGQYSPSVEAWGSFQNIRGTIQQDGSYTIGLLQAQPVKMRIAIGGVEHWIGGDSQETATVFAPRPGEVLQVPPWIESGVLCHLEGLGPRLSSNAQLLVRDAAGNTLRASTYPGPTISVCNLGPGRYWLYFYGDCGDEQPWASQWYDGVEFLEAATAIDLAPGQLARITVHLVPGGRIEGRVLAAGGEPVSGAQVAIYGQDRQPLCDWWRYMQGGVVLFTGLADGEYYVATSLQNELSWWYPGTADGDAALPIVIHDHATVSGIEWRLPEGASP